MDLDSRQTRRLYLAGTVAFPTPFPTAGSISIEDGSLFYSGVPQGTAFVVVQEESGRTRAAIRLVREDDVAAIFFPGVWVETEGKSVFRFAKQADDLEQGEWFLNPEINADQISERFSINVRSRDSGARGIAFVPEHLPLMTINERAETAGSAGELSTRWIDKMGCDCPCRW